MIMMMIFMMMIIIIKGPSHVLYQFHIRSSRPQSLHTQTGLKHSRLAGHKQKTDAQGA
jgi:hypothetical protein